MNLNQSIGLAGIIIWIICGLAWIYAANLHIRFLKMQIKKHKDEEGNDNVDYWKKDE